jgi:hypothetical protein
MELALRTDSRTYYVLPTALPLAPFGRLLDHPGEENPMIVSDASQPASAPAPSLWDRFIAFLKTPEGVLAALGGATALALLAAASRRPTRPVALPRAPSRALLPAYTPYEPPRRRALRRDEQLAINRERLSERVPGRPGRLK